MATHTDQGGANSYGRKFSIGRENGISDKNGTPHFFEWIKELPVQQSRRKFETREGKDGKQKHYELFRALDGLLVGLSVEEKTMFEFPQTWLILHLRDGDEDYYVEVGELSGRYAGDILKRLLDPNFDASLTFRISPYSILGENGKYNIGISAISGADQKLYADPKKNTGIEGVPQPKSREWKGKTDWDFSAVSQWLLDQVNKKVVPKLGLDPFAKWPDRVVMPSPGSNAVPVDVPEADDLPF